MTAVGKSATAVNFVDAVEADERTGLYDTITFAEPAHSRPWVFPRHFDKAIPFDNIEQMQMNASPQSTYVEGVVSALNRKMDDETIRAFFADRLVGENGSTTESFAAGFQFGVSVGGTTSGLNVEKLQNALEILRSNEVALEDGEQIYAVIAPKQERNLLNVLKRGDTFIKSADLVNIKTYALLPVIKCIYFCSVGECDCQVVGAFKKA
jgi:hypothetical protein